MAADSTMSDIQSLIESMNIRNGVNSRDVDYLAEKMRLTLGLSELAPGDFRSVAEKLLNLSLTRQSSAEQAPQVNDHSSFRPVDTAETVQQQKSESPRRPSALRNPLTAAVRGRSPARSLSNASATTGPPPAKTPRPLTPGRNVSAAVRMYENRARSPSPFGTRREEKKEDTAARSGRESPMFDPSAEKPMTPSRPSSPMPSPRATRNTFASPGRPGSRAASPSFFRPGLQEDEAKSPGSMSPCRPPVGAHTRTDSFTPRHTPRRSDDEDDESVQQPPRRSHRKSASETNVSDAGFDSVMSDLGMPELAETKASFSSDTTLHSSDAGVETVLTPMARQGLEDDMAKTGDFKLRRKTQTPYPSTATQTAGPSIFASQSSYASRPQQPGDFAFNPTISKASSFQEHMPAYQTTIGKSSSFQDDVRPFAVDLNKPTAAKRHSYLQKRNVHSHIGRKQTAKSTEHFPNHIGTTNQNPFMAANTASRQAPVASTPYVSVPSPQDVLSPMECEPIATTPPPPLAASTRTGYGEPSVFNIGTKPAIPMSARRNRVRPHSTPVQQTHVYPSFWNEPAAAIPSPSSSLPERRTPEEVKPSAEELERGRRMELVTAMRNEAREMYLAKDYKASISAHTQAIKLMDWVRGDETNDTLAVLLSNRAACFLMVNAFEASIADCEQGLAHVSVLPSTFTADDLSKDGGPILKVKILTRLAKAKLKMGDHHASSETLQTAIMEATETVSRIKRVLPADKAAMAETELNSMVTDATLGRVEASRLKELVDQITQCSVENIHNPGDRRNCSAALSHINMALKIASGCEKLYVSKLTFLTSMKRWREVAGCCERLAASVVPFDAVFVDDLYSKHPFRSIPPAMHLTADFFGQTSEEDASSDLKLNSRAAAEAVLRLPFKLTATYLRSLRLEERYPAADSALRALEEYVEMGTSEIDSVTLRSQFSWLARERGKLTRTRSGREKGDELFRLGDYDLAATQYGNCMLIDGEGVPGSEKGAAGGRLHAVLHCNRAACLMAVKRYHDAIEECTAALRIHPRYMKAMLRRSRCYVRLQRFEEAIAEYSRWMELVEEARASPRSTMSFVSPCNFDGPKDVPDNDISQVKRELDEAHRGKRRAEATAREQASRQRDRQNWHDNFSQSSWHGSASSYGFAGRSSSYSNRSSSASRRRDEWYNSENTDSRRWDSFSGKAPKGGQSRHSRSKSWGSSRQSSAAGSPGSDLSKSHYSVLGIKSNATEDEIKRAYRKLVLQYHPDKNPSTDAADKFRRIKLAYDELNEPEKRRRYDAANGF